MKTYQLRLANQRIIRYHDGKRHLWLLSVLLPFLALSGIGAYLAGGHEWTLAIPLLITYGVLPLLDVAIGHDPSNPPEALVPQLEADRYYRVLTMLTVPWHFVVLIVITWFVGHYHQQLSGWALLALVITAGSYSGLGINTAHELGHKKTALEQALARLALAVPAYGHFCVEHNRGHHRQVATPEDSASARMGESIYRFALREIPGGWRRGWAAERSRLTSEGKAVWSMHNTILQSYAVSLVVQGSLIIAFGWVLLPFLLLHNGWAWFQLTSANYIEHYGLLRTKLADGRYEACRPEHSWNANHLLSNVMVFHLQRHSDHHANPARRYQSLRSFDNLPELPNGYYGMFFIAYWPWLWFRVMDRRLLSLPHIRGDLQRVNVDPRSHHRLAARYCPQQ